MFGLLNNNREKPFNLVFFLNFTIHWSILPLFFAMWWKGGEGSQTIKTKPYVNSDIIQIIEFVTQGICFHNSCLEFSKSPQNGCDLVVANSGRTIIERSLNFSTFVISLHLLDWVNYPTKMCRSFSWFLFYQRHY